MCSAAVTTHSPTGWKQPLPCPGVTTRNTLTYTPLQVPPSGSRINCQWLRVLLYFGGRSSIVSFNFIYFLSQQNYVKGDLVLKSHGTIYLVLSVRQAKNCTTNRLGSRGGIRAGARREGRETRRVRTALPGRRNRGPRPGRARRIESAAPASRPVGRTPRDRRLAAAGGPPRPRGNRRRGGSPEDGRPSGRPRAPPLPGAEKCSPLELKNGRRRFDIRSEGQGDANRSSPNADRTTPRRHPSTFASKFSVGRIDTMHRPVRVPCQLFIHHLNDKSKSSPMPCSILASDLVRE